MAPERGRYVGSVPAQAVRKTAARVCLHGNQLADMREPPGNTEALPGNGEKRLVPRPSTTKDQREDI